MPRFWTVVGFTGHRKLPAPALVDAALRSCLDELHRPRAGRLAAVSSAAAGADTIFAHAVLARSIPWLVILPFARDEFARDFTPEQWREVDGLLLQAASVQTAPTTGSRDEAYLEAGLRTVDECDVLVAVWNGAPAAGVGGTAEVVAYARQVGRPLIWIHSETGIIVRERLDQIPVPPALPATTEPTGRATVEQLFAEFDTDALRHAPAAKHIIAIVILLHLVASGTGVTSMMLGLAGTAAYAVAGFKMACLVASLWLVVRHRHAHHEWMRTRISAEMCRSALATWILPDPELSFPKTRVPGFEQLQRTLRLERLADRTPRLTLEQTRDTYLEKRVRDQAAYFSRQFARAAPRHRLMKGTASASTIAAIVLGILVLVLSLLHVGGPAFLLVKGLSLTLPLLNAALLSFVAAHDLGRRVSRYDEMARTLETLAVRMSHVRSWSSLERLATETETALIQEALEWHSVSRFASRGR